MANSSVSPFAGVKNFKLSMSKLELNYSPLSSFIKSLHCTTQCTSNNLRSPFGSLAHVVHQCKTFLLHCSPTHAHPSYVGTTCIQDHVLSHQLSFWNPHQYYCYSCWNQSPSMAPMLPGIKWTFLIEPTRPWVILPGSRLHYSHTSSCSLHVRKTSLLWTYQPSPSHTQRTHLHCSEPCPITFFQINAGQTLQWPTGTRGQNI